MFPIELAVEQLTLMRHQTVLHTNLSFSVQRGGIMQITGGNGSGKTTLLQVLAGLRPIEEGGVYFRGEPLQRVFETYKTKLVYLGHRLAIKPELSVSETLFFMRRLYNLPEHKSHETLLSTLGLEKKANHLVKTLSAGQQKKLALARLLLSNATVWLLDEPFSALDEASIQWLQRLLTQHSKEETTIIFTSHQPVHLSGVTLQKVAL